MALQFGYIGLTLLINLILLLIGIKAIDKTFVDSSKAKTKKALLLSCLITWQLYIFAIATDTAYKGWCRNKMNFWINAISINMNAMPMAAK